MKLHELSCFPDERKQKKRRGRGPASGLGCTAGKGNKGQKVRAGSGPAVGFEGGQMPLTRRLPKRGFTNIFKVDYSIVNLERIEAAFPEKEQIGLDDLMALCRSKGPIKVLGQGSISRPVTIEAHKFSSSARQKIEDAGGSVRALEG